MQNPHSKAIRTPVYSLFNMLAANDITHFLS